MNTNQKKMFQEFCCISNGQFFEFLNRNFCAYESRYEENCKCYISFVIVMVDKYHFDRTIGMIVHVHYNITVYTVTSVSSIIGKQILPFLHDNHSQSKISYKRSLKKNQTSKYFTEIIQPFGT